MKDQILAIIPIQTVCSICIIRKQRNHGGKTSTKYLLTEKISLVSIPFLILYHNDMLWYSEILKWRKKTLRLRTALSQMRRELSTDEVGH